MCQYFTAVRQYSSYIAYFLLLNGKGKGKVIPLQALCGPEGGQRYSCTVPWPRHLKGVSGQ